MNRYIVLYLAPKNVSERFAQATPEEAQHGLKLWIDWNTKLGSSLLDLGKPLGHAMRVTPTSVGSADSNIIGMSILQAESMDSALEMVKDHHHLHWDVGCEILLLEELPIPELQA
ncbi:MAG: hypothetical protein U0670_17255 [Anaerolineae bacterium]